MDFQEMVDGMVGKEDKAEHMDMQHGDAKAKACEMIDKAVAMLEKAGLDAKEVIDAHLSGEKADAEEMPEAAEGEEAPEAEEKVSPEEKGQKKMLAIAFLKKKAGKA
jgi:hypothetical protein